MIHKKLISPFQKFVKTESLSGFLLFGATIIALIWVNTSFSNIYNSLWQYKIGISIIDFEIEKPLILWINDGLMAVFFFLIGLEIKRELLIGELNSVKKATFPLLAALGGMLFPVTIFLILNQNPDTSAGWGIPMATDIAFTLAILQLLGNRVPLTLKIFLTAFAIVDDIGAVFVIAVFYSSNINWILLIYAFLLLGILFYLSFKKVYAKYLIIIFGIIIWFLFLKAGIHPTVAGVLLALAVPIRQKIGIATYVEKLSSITKNIESTSGEEKHILTNKQIELIDDLEDWSIQVQSPLQHLEHKLHNPVAYFIIPLFALSNAGVSFNVNMDFDFQLIISIALSLFIGNVIGISLISYLGVKLKITELPADIGFKHIIGVAFLAGFGFTMSIFIANLAFGTQAAYLESAKIGILIGSIVSGITGFLILRNTATKDIKK